LEDDLAQLLDDWESELQNLSGTDPEGLLKFYRRPKYQSKLRRLISRLNEFPGEENLIYYALEFELEAKKHMIEWMKEATQQIHSEIRKKRKQVVE
jgi:hypothetical protein